LTIPRNRFACRPGRGQTVLEESDVPPHKVPLAGSERHALQGARRGARISENQPVDVTVVLRPRSALHRRLATLATQAPADRAHLSADEFDAAHGAAPEDLAAVQAFAADSGLEVMDVDVSRRSIALRGTAAAMERAFGVELAHYEHDGGGYRGREGPLHLPAEIAPAVVAVLGLDDRRQVRPHSRERVSTSGTGNDAFTAAELAELYDFPASTDGTGERIAILAFGGGYNDADLDAYFRELGLKAPSITPVSVDGAVNAPGKDPQADGEVALDVEVVGAAAPGAEMLVFFAPNTARGFHDAITAATHDVRTPSVIGLSWGNAEATWAPADVNAIDLACQAAAVLGITICVASGDEGSSDTVPPDKQARVDFPASSPSALGVGGTRLQATGGHITSEVVWGEPYGPASGGGVSDLFDLPAWQQDAHVPPSANPNRRVGRGVPDVAAHAAGYKLYFGGKGRVRDGTSAAAPLWAGLVARANQGLGRRVGLLSATVYGLAATGTFRDITRGSNGAYHATVGWDACTGLGTPNGDKLLAALAGTTR
jgi:kumamolisin